MKLQLAQTEGWNTFTAYGEDYVSVNAVRHQDNLIVLPYQLIEKWTAASFSSLSGADFDFLVGDWQVGHRRLRKRLVGSQDWDEFGGTLRN